MNLKNKIILLVFLITAFLIVTFGISAQNHFLAAFDAQTANAFGVLHSASLDKIMLAVTKVGNIYESFAIFLVFGLYIISKRKKYLFYIFAISTGLGITLVEAIKILVERARPPMNLLIETGSSFPSAHATISAIYLLSAVILIAPLLRNRFSKIVWITICSIIFPLVALSRIYLSVHFTSDVIAGIIIGSACYLFANIVVVHHYSYKE